MLTLILAAVALAGIACIVVALLGWSRIIDWFRSFFANKNRIKDMDDIAFTIKTQIDNGNVKVVQGVFNKISEEIEDGIQYEAERLDDKLEGYHRDNELVVYE